MTTDVDLDDGWIDLGNGHTFRFHGWSPDRELNPHLSHLPDLDRCGGEEVHPDKRDPSKRCVGGLFFDLPGVSEVFPNNPRWTVESFEPLTLSPSVLCHICGNHGFIREGRWIDA